MTENKNPNRRYVGKVKEMEGKYGKFANLLIDNPDMSSEYSKGSLIWIDKETGKKFLVKSFNINAAPDFLLEKGFTQSVVLNLDNEYQVSEID